MSAELAHKLDRLRNWMQDRRLEAVLLGRQPNFSWLTCGGEAHVPLNSDLATARIVVTRDRAHLIANRIEMPRLEREALPAWDAELKVHDWHDPAAASRLFTSVAHPDRTASDTGEWGTREAASDLAPLRYDFHPLEKRRYRKLGSDVEKALRQACQQVKSGQTEYEIASFLAREAWALELTPIVLLVATDQRIRQFRHPLPTKKKLRKHAMLVLVARRGGQFAAATRILHFGPIPRDIRRRHDAVCAVDAHLQAASVPGARVADVFRKGMEVYAEHGFPNEWEHHHQGGATGYLGREYLGSPDSSQIVRENQPFAWNPSIAGTKSEDTLLSGARGPEIVTAARDWPMLSIPVNDKVLLRPDILES